MSIDVVRDEWNVSIEERRTGVVTDCGEVEECGDGD